MNSVSFSTLLVKKTRLRPLKHALTPKYSKVYFQLKDRPTTSKNFLLGS